MMEQADSLKLPSEAETLSPLPAEVHNGLVALTVLGLASLVSGCWLFLYITYRLIRWRCAQRSQRGRRDETAANGGVTPLEEDLSLGLSEAHFSRLKLKTKVPSTPQAPPPHTAATATKTTAGPEDPAGGCRMAPLLLIIYNLLLADIQQAFAFTLSIVWLRDDAIHSAPSRVCWAQAWFLTIGKLASCGFLAAISANTYLAVVRGRRPPQWAVYLATAAIWVFAHAMTISGVLATENGRPVGGYYVRAGAWCWVNCRYGQLRLWLEYFWIFLAIGLTVVLHGLVLAHLYRRGQTLRDLLRGVSLCPATGGGGVDGSEPPRPSGHHPAFLVYPVIWIMCITPLALGRMLAMGGSDPSLRFYAWAGCMLASHGWLNVALWSSTIAFIGPRGKQETGLDRFAFVRTPHHRRFGNMIWVRGGCEKPDESRVRDGQSWLSSLWRVGGSGGGRRSGRYGGAAGGVSQESLHRSEAATPEHGIQMEIVTTVIVEPADPTMSMGTIMSGEGTRTSVESHAKEFG